MSAHRLPTGFLAWVRRQSAAPRDLIWYAELGDRLVALRPREVYGSGWLADLRGTGLSRDVAYKSMALVAVLTRKQIRRYARGGLSWSHATAALGAAGRAVKAETEKQTAGRRKTVEGLLDRAANGRWSVRRLRQQAASMGKVASPRGRAARCLQSRGRDADLALLNRMAADWVKHGAVWEAVAAPPRRPGQVTARHRPLIETAVASLDELIHSARVVRTALAATIAGRTTG